MQKLTKRLSEVLTLRQQGLKYKDIAKKLGISHYTVKIHAHRLISIGAMQPKPRIQHINGGQALEIVIRHAQNPGELLQRLSVLFPGDKPINLYRWAQDMGQTLTDEEIYKALQTDIRKRNETNKGHDQGLDNPGE